jgi:hypothetical protein
MSKTVVAKASTNGHVNRVKDALAESKTKSERTASAPMELPALDIQVMDITIVGDSSLIVHRFDEKMKTKMKEKQEQIASAGREKRDPQADYEGSLYKLPGGKFGFPAVAFKNAAVTACTSLGKSISKVAARQAFHVMGDMVEIKGKPNMREDMVRVGMSKSADIRYRGEFKEWSCTLRIRFNARVLSAQQIVNLINTAGFAVGVGEWRPEKNGQFGLFHCV